MKYQKMFMNLYFGHLGVGLKPLITETTLCQKLKPAMKQYLSTENWLTNKVQSILMKYM